MATFKRLGSTPSYDLAPQDFPVQPGTIKYGYGDGVDAIVDYAQFRPKLTSRTGEIPDSLRRSAVGPDIVRPLLRGNSDGSPMSFADMVGRRETMNALDDLYDIGPAANEAQASKFEAETSRNKALAEDPIYLERAQNDLAMQRRAFDVDLQGRLARDKDEAQYSTYDQLVDEDAASQLEELRRRPSYAAAPPEKRAAAEQAVIEEARQKKAETRRLGIAGYPRTQTFNPEG